MASSSFACAPAATRKRERENERMREGSETLEGIDKFKSLQL